MAPTLTLRFLTLVLFFFANDQSISARDLKVELGDEEQVDSKGEPYITQYENTKPNYATSYTTTKHDNHLPHHGKLSNQPYTSGYNGDKTSHSDHDSSKPFTGGYTTSYNGYKTSTHDSNRPYTTAYGDRDSSKPSTGGYTASYNGYKTNTHDTNGPYTTAYRDRDSSKPSTGGYTASYNGYKTHTHDSNGPYIATYGDRDSNKPSTGGYPASYNGYKTSTHDSNGPYTTAYDDHDSSKPSTSGYTTSNNVYKTSTHDSNGPYITAYGDRDSSKPSASGYTASYNRYKTSTHDSNGPYTAAYGDRDSSKPSIGGYTTSYNGNKTRTQDSNGSYIASYGDRDSNKPYNGEYKSISSDSKRSTYIDPEDSNGPPSPNMDHTEAFKTGFFTLDDLYVGNAMTLQFPIQEDSPYLSRKEADSIPLSVSQLPSFLQLFSIPENSAEAKSFKGTLDQCEGEPITGETKICANSLETILEFIDKVIGSDTKHNILSTSYPSPSAIPLQKYTILEVSHDIDAPKWVACHPLPYPYAIHYCHFIATGTKVFKVSLVGENNGDKMEALGICHLDTSDWSPDHIIFKQLGIKAGKETAVCHFLPVKHLMWIPQPSKDTM